VLHKINDTGGGAMCRKELLGSNLKPLTGYSENLPGFIHYD